MSRARALTLRRGLDGPAIAEEAKASEAEEHHRPGRRFGNAARSEWRTAEVENWRRKHLQFAVNHLRSEDREIVARWRALPPAIEIDRAGRLGVRKKADNVQAETKHILEANEVLRTGGQRDGRKDYPAAPPLAPTDTSPVAIGAPPAVLSNTTVTVLVTGAGLPMGSKKVEMPVRL